MLHISELLLAVTPIAIYLLLVGYLNLRTRPYVLSGARESVLVGLALSGMALIGPMSLFFPQQAANKFGPYVWLMLVVFYGLLVLLWILIAPPRLVVYNISVAQLRAVLAEVALKLDPEARWAGDSLAMPQLEVQLHLEPFDVMRNVTLLGTGAQHSFSGWRRLEAHLRTALAETQVVRNSHGYSFVLVGLLLLGSLLTKVASDPQEVAQHLLQLLRL